MKKDFLYAIIIIVAIAGICFGLAKIRPDFVPTKSQPYHIDQVQTAPKKANEAPGKVIMRVNGEPVTDLEFQTYIAGMPEQAQQMAQMPQGRRLIAEQVASLVALAQEGRKMGIQNDKETKLRLETEETNVVAMAALRKLVTPDDAKVREEFNKRKGNFDSIELKHVLIAYEGGQVPARQGSAALPLPAAMDKAKQIEAQLRGGADFGLVARAVSDDTASAQQGGEIGSVSRESLPADVAAEVFTLKPGEISRPLRTPFGVHIFKAGARKSPSYEQLKPQIEAELQQKSAKDTVEKIRKGSKIDLDPAFFGPEEKPKAPGPKNPS